MINRKSLPRSWRPSYHQKSISFLLFLHNLTDEIINLPDFFLPESKFLRHVGSVEVIESFHLAKGQTAEIDVFLVLGGQVEGVEVENFFAS